MELKGKTRREVAREEMNLVELPLAVLSDRDRRKTLELSDSIPDKSVGRDIKRTWIITAADRWGLPVGVDADLCLALQKLTFEKNRLSDGVVPFSIYELREELGWPHDGRYNNRIKTGFERILGVTIECVNSWRKNGRWVSLDAFHILERVCLSNTVAKYDPEEMQRFKWNEVVLESMKSGNVKKLDWEFYLGLESSVSKRLYRFVDKRFGILDRFSHDVVPFCENKMGMWQLRKTNYRQTLMAGVDELMRKGVLRRKSQEEMFTGRGLHQRIVFERPTRHKGVEVTPIPQQQKTTRVVASKSSMATELVARGVSPARANFWADKNPGEAKRQIEFFDFRTSTGWKPANAGGYLNTAIESKQGPPVGFVSEADKQQQRKEKEVREAKARAESLEADKRAVVGKRKHAERSQVVNAHLSKLSVEQQRELIDTAFRAAPSQDNRIGRDSEMTRVDVVFRFLQKSSAT